MPLYDLKAKVWWAISEHKPVFSHETMNSKHYVRLILSPSFDRLTDEEKLFWHFMQDNAMVGTANNPMEALGERVVSQRFQLRKSHNLMPHYFYLWGTLKDKVYVNIFNSSEELQENIMHKISTIPVQQLHWMPKNIL
jgi:hypothetical protein